MARHLPSRKLTFESRVMVPLTFRIVYPVQTDVWLIPALRWDRGLAPTPLAIFIQPASSASCHVAVARAVKPHEAPHALPFSICVNGVDPAPFIPGTSVPASRLRREHSGRNKKSQSTDLVLKPGRGADHLGKCMPAYSRVAQTPRMTPATSSPCPGDVSSCSLPLAENTPDER